MTLSPNTPVHALNFAHDERLGRCLVVRGSIDSDGARSPEGNSGGGGNSVWSALPSAPASSIARIPRREGLLLNFASEDRQGFYPIYTTWRSKSGSPMNFTAVMLRRSCGDRRLSLRFN
jgi:hypothetical protein